MPLSGSTSRFLFYSPRLDGAFDIFGNGQPCCAAAGACIALTTLCRAITTPLLRIPPWVPLVWSCNENDPNCLTWETIDNYKQTPPPFNGVTGLGPGLKSVSTLNPNDTEQPVVYAYSVNIDQVLPSKFRLELSYVGNQSKDFQSQFNYDAIPYGAMFSAPAGGAACSIEAQSCQQLYRP